LTGYSRVRSGRCALPDSKAERAESPEQNNSARGGGTGTLRPRNIRPRLPGERILETYPLAPAEGKGKHISPVSGGTGISRKILLKCPAGDYMLFLTEGCLTLKGSRKEMHTAGRLVARGGGMATRDNLSGGFSMPCANTAAAAAWGISEYVWERHRSEIQTSGDLLYTWQFEIRRVAVELIAAGKIRHGELQHECCANPVSSYWKTAPRDFSNCRERTGKSGGGLIAIEKAQ